MRKKILEFGAGIFCFVLLLVPTRSEAGLVKASWNKPAISLGIEYPRLKNSESPGSINREWKRSFGSEIKYEGRHSPLVLGVDDVGRGGGSGGSDKAAFRNSVGIPFLSLPLFSWAKYDQNNQLRGFRGINYGLGYSSKTYFNPPIKHAWNTFWQWGTVYFLIPYIGVGTEYTTDHVYFELATLYVIPYIGVGVHF